AIEKIEVKKEHKTVYNFKVKDFHTYFVSNLGIWTHNSCGITNSKELLEDIQKSLNINDVNVGLKGQTLDRATVIDAAKKFTGTNSAKIDTTNGIWDFISKDGKHTVRMMQKKRNGNWEANFEIRDSKGKLDKNYHIHLRD
ncbi:polymorphic toxin-type HINT domain-containing protein, partial [Bacillus thuringiensis]|nr:polymorphic toxin-type HINT domain-containing protein [Bacillus thuringiensis]